MNKKRYWAFVLYPESAPSDWKDILQSTGLICAISPYHDKDINPDGTIKKPHYHIILAFAGPTTFKTVKRITDELNQPIPIPLEAVKGMYRYHIHQDNPEKFQYKDSDRQFINGFSINDFIELSANEVLDIERQVIQFIRDNDIYEYSDLVNLLQDNNMTTELNVVCSHTIFFNSYVSSIRYKREKKIRKLENLT